MNTRKGKNGGTINVWQPGESGNPSGPKPGYVQAKTVLKRLLAAKGKFKNPLTGEEEEMQLGEALHLVQIHKAANEADTIAYREILDRIEGKPKQTIGGEGDEPIKIAQEVTILQIAFRPPEGSEPTASPSSKKPKGKKPSK